MADKIVLAVDLGAESGRVMAVHTDGRDLRLDELHRFPNETVTVRGTLHWDFLRLWRDIQDGLRKGLALHPATLGVDTWGVDFALLDAQGTLIGNPVHYRDARTQGMMEKAFQRVPQSEIFTQTGIQFMPINSLYQLLSLVDARSPQLEIAATFLTVPDLINYWLTGEKACEFSNATTTQMINPIQANWAYAMLKAMEIPTHIFPPVIPSGTRIGTYENIPVIAPACHDTGSAVAAIPVETPNFGYISSGTWSLVGLERPVPVINPAALQANVTNEGGVYGSYRLLKNVMGLWILQQCRETWSRQGTQLSYRELVSEAGQAASCGSFIEPNDPLFLSPGDHPQRIQEACRQSGQRVPDTRGQMVRLVLESLALKYRQVLESLQQLTGQPVEVIHIVGGGSRNELLCQMTADAAGVPVVAGPVEATVIGNALVQLIATGELAGLSEARRLVRQMSDMKRFDPQQGEWWQLAYQRISGLAAGGRPPL
jgi:rhamnulokinase